MGSEDSIAAQHNRYVRSGMWRCPKAPIDQTVALQVAEQTGAHYWTMKNFGGKIGTAWVCIHCYDVRQFEVKTTGRRRESISLN